MSATDSLITYADLEARWHITGPNAKAIRKALLRRCEALGLQRLRGTRGDATLFRPADVLKAEARAAGERRIA